jgi:hypothetical protein
MIHQRIGDPRISSWVAQSLLPERTLHTDDTRPACHGWTVPAERPPRDADPLLAIQAWQNGRCALCGRGDWNRFKVDHCHRTGLIRGELCGPCNTSESRREDPAVVQYRLRPPSVLLGATRPYDGHDPRLYGSAPVSAPADPYEAARFLESASSETPPEPKPLAVDTPDWLDNVLGEAQRRFAR